MFRILLLTLFVHVLLSCDPAVEGCMDPKSNNFNAEADKNCCCGYTEVGLNIKHRYGTDTLKLNTNYTDGQGDSFQVQSISMLFSQLQLFDDQNNQYTTAEIMTVPLQNTNLVNVPNSFLIGRADSNATQGPMMNFTRQDNYTAFELYLGIPQDYKDIEPLGIGTGDEESLNDNSGHELALNSGLYISRDKGYAAMKINCQYNNPLDNSLVQRNFAIDGQYLYSFQKAYVLDAANIFLDLTIDYQQLFQNVSFVQDDSLSIVNKIKQNLPLSIQ